MKTLNLSVVIMALVALSTQTAGASCLDQAKQKSGDVNTGVGILVGGGFFGFFIPPAAAVTMAAGGAVWLLASRPRTMVKIFEQASTCSGKQIHKLYQRYLKRYPQSDVTKDEFCKLINEGDLNERLCPSSLPSKAYILEFIDER